MVDPNEIQADEVVSMLVFIVLPLVVAPFVMYGCLLAASKLLSKPLIRWLDRLKGR